MSCRGICHRYKAEKPALPATRYGNGQKRCNTCDMFIEWDGNHCPCCGSNLRTKPKGTGSRHQLMIIQQIKRI
ncbi:MAG: hypothetical protein OEL56_07485 [Nitrosopumilus sp.]|nr:hypothetical protein [Nitrosopumilus sp.]MDH3565619.1 hypothetical protein [Nitrosopumilus sp.]MDH5416571.1 hypothetical protein [Nitrosopumilus sp.]MDH5555171.1 hypothetical protein [Nitrosopumilus sp.]